MKLKCLVVDDEPLARELLKDYIEKLHPTLQLTGQCSNALEAQNYISNNTVDILFLDIEMTDLNGIDFLNSLSSPPLTVFTTAYSEYAAKTYELENVVDYLVKPIAFNRFVKTTNRIVDILNKGSKLSNEENTPIESIEIQKKEEANEDFIFIKNEGKFIKVKHLDIRYIESYGEYAKIYLDNSMIMSRLSLSKIIDNLPSNRFIRIHRSYIINVSFLSHLEGNQVTIKDKKIPVSRGKKEELLNFIKNNSFND